MRVLETALYAPNLDETAAFYERVLGLTRIGTEPGRHVFFRLEDAVLLLFRAEATRVPPAEGALGVPPHGADGQGHVCFAATGVELAGWRRRLSAHGVPIETELAWPQGGRSIYVRDPAGNSVEFAERRIWGLA